jgi:tripartite-type tricarboxylate transporter receptor subunit TctC
MIARSFIALAAVIAALGGAQAQVQDYPNRPITLVVRRGRSPRPRPTATRW